MRTGGHLSLLLATMVGFAGCTGMALTPEELALKQNLAVLRRVLEQFEADKPRSPESLDSLVKAGYFRMLPYDAVTKSNKSWVEVRDGGVGVEGVRSGAIGYASDGTRYFDW